MDVDVMFRPGAVSQAKTKAALNAAPVYMYLFTWQSPVMDGNIRQYTAWKYHLCSTTSHAANK